MRYILTILTILTLHISCDMQPSLPISPAQIASAQTGSGSSTYHIYRERTPTGLKGAQILNGISSDKAVLDEGDTYIHQGKVYIVIARTALNFSGLFAHLYVWEYDEETTRIFIEIGIIDP